MTMKMEISSSLEDYLEAIATIIETNGHAHAKDIAEMLGVTMPSVTNALQALSARGMLVYRSHLPVKLTATGSEKAAVIRRRHATLKRFFSELLKLEEGPADSAACKMEHAADELTLARLTAMTEAIVGRDDCAPLRRYLTETMPQIHPAEDAVLVSLAELQRGGLDDPRIGFGEFFCEHPGVGEHPQRVVEVVPARAGAEFQTGPFAQQSVFFGKFRHCCESMFS